MVNITNLNMGISFFMIPKYGQFKNSKLFAVSGKEEDILAHADLKYDIQITQEKKVEMSSQRLYTPPSCFCSSRNRM